MTTSHESISFDGPVKSQDLTPSHKDHKVNMLILNEIFLRVLSAFVRKYSFHGSISFAFRLKNCLTEGLGL